eukprot:1124234-Rhodomonas_salina.2
MQSTNPHPVSVSRNNSPFLQTAWSATARRAKALARSHPRTLLPPPRSPAPATRSHRRSQPSTPVVNVNHLINAPRSQSVREGEREVLPARSPPLGPPPGVPGRPGSGLRSTWA